MKWYSITIENREPYEDEKINDTGGIEWIAIDVEGKEYSGFWQTGSSLTDKEIEKILSILISKTDKLYTKKDWGHLL